MNIQHVAINNTGILYINTLLITTYSQLYFIFLLQTPQCFMASRIICLKLLCVVPDEPPENSSNA